MKQSDQMSWDDHDILCDLALTSGTMVDKGPCPDCEEPGNRDCTACHGRGRLEEFVDED